MVMSTVGTAFAMIVMGSYLTLKSMEYDVNDLAWVPIAAFSSIVFFANWGILSLPFLIISEILPDKLKDIGSLMCMTLLALFAAIMLKGLPYMNAAFGLHICLYVFAGICFIGTLVIVRILPETNGKTPAEIQKILQNRKT